MAKTSSRPLARSSPQGGGGGRDLLLFPCIFLERGTLVFPVEGQERNEEFRDPNGEPVDIFDAVDHLLATYHRLYVVDVEGILYERPQFEYLQELVKGEEMWVDAGCRDADQVTDVLVAGATRAVLSTSTLESAREISRTLKLTSQVALDIVQRDGAVVSDDTGIAGARVEDLAREARTKGISDIILSSGSTVVDWGLVRAVAQEGPTYVGGPFFVEATEALASAGARGGIFPAKGVLRRWMTSGS